MKNFGFFVVMVAVLFSATVSFASIEFKEYKTIVPGELYVAGSCRVQFIGDEIIFSFSKYIAGSTYIVQETRYNPETKISTTGYATTFEKDGKVLYQPISLGEDIFHSPCCYGAIRGNNIPESTRDAISDYCSGN